MVRKKKTSQKIKEVQIRRYSQVATAFEVPPKEPTKREILESRLQDSTFILAGGAWQHLWERSTSQSMGFNAQSPQTDTLPSQEELRSSITPELLKRFRSEIAIMPAMSKEDYVVAASHIVETLPQQYRAKFSSLVSKGIADAVQQMLGMRFFEEILSKTLTKPLCNQDKTQKETQINPF